MDIKEIQNLIKFVAKSGAYEVEIEKKDFKITIKTSSNSSTTIKSLPVAQTLSNEQNSHVISNQEDNNDNQTENDKYTVIKSPIIGTFFRKSGPDKPVFLDVGSEVKKGETMCVIEAMKLFNEIESEMNCKIIKILVEDETPVEFDQPLFLVDPS
jgi:acetyl-CoA carboxylase biotin carboxyl carrier protein|tara:strand:+ start:4079 stop:4543 length:465 start_codon:yes stop_codon:yes gene_type:complete